MPKCLLRFVAIVFRVSGTRGNAVTWKSICNCHCKSSQLTEHLYTASFTCLTYLCLFEESKKLKRTRGGNRRSSWVNFLYAAGTSAVREAPKFNESGVAALQFPSFPPASCSSAISSFGSASSVSLSFSDQKLDMCALKRIFLVFCLFVESRFLRPRTWITFREVHASL